MKKLCILLLAVSLLCPSRLSAQKAPIHVTFFGSSVCRGAGAEQLRGYACKFFHSGAIDTTRYAYFNASTGGDNTLKVDQEQRLTKKLYPTHPNIVVIGLSLGNEGIGTPQSDAGRETVLEQFRGRLLALSDSLDKQGMKPVIVNCYANANFSEPQYTCTKRMNSIINTWKYPSINVLGTIDDGEGKWVEGFVHDPLHPNTEGHREMYLSIVPTLFDAMMQGKRTPAYDWRKSYTTIENPKKEDAIYVDVDDTIHSFAMSFRFKNATDGVIASFETNKGMREVVVNNHRISYLSATTAYQEDSDSWNHVVITHNYANQRTLFAVNGKVIGEFKERLIPTRFVYGGTVQKIDLKDLGLHRSSLNRDEIADLNNKLFIQSSLEVYTPMTAEVRGGLLPNMAQSLTSLELNPNVALTRVEKPFY